MAPDEPVGEKAFSSTDGALPARDSDASRIAAIARYGILDTAREAAFDDVAELAADILDAPMAVVNFVADDRQWFKAEIGIGQSEMPLDVSICRHAILQPGVMVVNDLSQDARFDDNPLVNIAEGLRFYAGAVLQTPEGIPVGTVCVLDNAPRPDGISRRQERALRMLAMHTMAQLELRRSVAMAEAQTRRAERHAGRVSLLAKGTARLLAASEPEAMIGELYALLERPFDLNACFFYACNAPELRLVASAGLTAEQQRQAAQVEFGQSVCRIVAQTRQVANIVGIQVSDDPDVALLKALRLDSYFSAPLISQGEVFGTLSFGRTGDRFSSGEQEVMRTLANHVATAIERSRADERLRANESRLSAMFDQATAGIVRVDRSGRLLEANDRYCEMLDRTRTDLLRLGIQDVTHPDDLAENLRLFAATAAGGPSFDIEKRYLRPDGTAIWVRNSVNGVSEKDGTMSVLAVSIDITDRKLTEARLLESETRFRNMADHAPVMMWVTDPTGYCTYLNARWYAFTGQADGAGEAYGWLDAVHPDDRPIAEAAFVAANAEQRNYQVDFRLRRADGVYRWALDAAAARFDTDGTYLGYVGSVIDIDERKIAEAELEARVAAALAEQAITEEALRQSQKMEAVGQLTGGIAHDFNNMLAVVIGSLDLLGRRVGNADARAKRYIDAATEGARRAATLTQRLLAFSRQQPLNPEPVDVNRLVTGMSELIRGSMGSHIQIQTVLTGGGWRTLADANQLENVILNLAVNSRDAMPDGGRLTIETQNTHLDERYAAANVGVTAGQYVLIAISDTGTGMPEAVIAKAFDPFFTTKEVGKGTGLGLSQVYGFVKQSGGHVKIYSEPGQGTSVKVYMPRLVGGDMPAISDTDVADLPLGEQEEVVLVVEDEPAVRQFSVDALTELGYRVLEADGAAAALRLLDAHPEIGLMFTDVVMPEVNGARLAEAARQTRPELKILFTTGYSRNAVYHNGVLDPGVELIGKPFSIEELAAKVREVLDRPAGGV